MTIPKDEYTKTPNIALGIMARSPAAGRIYATLIRLTYGWHKTTAEISIASFQRMTGLSVNSVKKGLRDLIRIGAVKRTNPNSIKNAEWEILDPSKIDPSNYDPSFIDGYPNRQASKNDGSSNKNPSKIDPHYAPIKESIKDKKKDSDRVADLISTFEKQISETCPVKLREKIFQFSEERIKDAIHITSSQDNVNKPWNYILAILNNKNGSTNTGAKNVNANKRGSEERKQSNYTQSDHETAERIKSKHRK